jgi:acetyltransferase-like isoleucine patch superfamily enzyme
MIRRVYKILWEMRIASQKKLVARKAAGSYRTGQGTTVSARNLDFTGNGSIHLGSDSNIFGRLSTRLPKSLIAVGDRCFIGHGCTIVSADSIRIGNDVLIGDNCYISDNDGHSLDLNLRKIDVTNSKNGIKEWNSIIKKAVVIDDHAWIAPRCIIMKGVTIGRGSIVGAGSVVTKSIPPMSLVAGNPARFIKQLE